MLCSISHHKVELFFGWMIKTLHKNQFILKTDETKREEAKNCCLSSMLRIAENEDTQHVQFSPRLGFHVWNETIQRNSIQQKRKSMKIFQPISRVCWRGDRKAFKSCKRVEHLAWNLLTLKRIDSAQAKDERTKQELRRKNYDSSAWKKVHFDEGGTRFLHSFLNNTNFTLGVLNLKMYTHIHSTSPKFMYAKIVKARTMFYVFCFFGIALKNRSRDSLEHAHNSLNAL